MSPSLDELIQAPTPVLLDFWGTWCATCRAMHPVLDELQAEMGERVRIVRIDVDEHTDLAVRMKVMGVPAFMVFKNGSEKGKLIGVTPRDQIEGMIKRAM